MSCYDEARDAWDSMSERDLLNKYKADDSRDDFCRSEDKLKNLLLEKYLDKKGIAETPYSHSQEFWSEKTKALNKLIKKLEKKKDK